MLAWFASRFRDPVFLLIAVAALSAMVVQSGELGSADTAHRLQSTHSFWTSEPEVFPNEYPEFGLYGRGGQLRSWYGMGQSLLMLPADIAGTYLERLPIFSEYNGNDPSIRSIFVSYTTNVLLNILTVLVCLRFLRLLGFSDRQAIAGILALLFCTTRLHYTQNMMENNYILLLTLMGFAFQFEWLKTGNRRALIIGSTALGLNLLTRLTTGLDLMAVGTFLLLFLWFEEVDKKIIGSQILAYIRVSVPIYFVFLLIDRAYQYYRFGSFFNTYVAIFAQKYKSLDPTLPSNYPWETPFHVGLFGAFFTPEKSIFVFDPLILLTILIVIWAWKRFTPAVKAYIVAIFFLLLAYICFYARYTVWSGDFAWGDRYVSTTVELAAFISVPLLLRYRVEAGRFLLTAGVALVAVSLVIQIASLAFWLPLEIYQMETFGHPTFVIALRFKNIAAFAMGKMETWGLMTPSMSEDPWDFVHIMTWNFLPFLLRRVGEAPAWVVQMTFVLWSALVALFLWMLVRLRNALSAVRSPN